MFTSTSMRPQRSSTSAAMRSTSSSDATSTVAHAVRVRGRRLLGALQVGDHDPRAVLREPSAMAFPMPFAPPVTMATLPSVHGETVGRSVGWV